MKIAVVSRLLCVVALLGLAGGSSAADAAALVNKPDSLDGVISQERNTQALSLSDLSWANSWFSSKAADQQSWQQLRAWLDQRRKVLLARVTAELDRQGIAHPALGATGAPVIGSACFGDSACELAADKLELLEHFDQFEELGRAAEEARPYIESFRAAISLVEAFGQPSSATPFAARIHEMYVLDQALRNGSVGFPAGLHHAMSPHAWLIFQTLMAEDTRALDRLHTGLMKTYFKTHAFPTKRAVGAETQAEIWTLVQHDDADPLFQHAVLEKMQHLIPKGELAEPKDYAYLYDRVMLKLDGSQRYGTQTTGCSATQPLPLEAPKRVDQYRASVGLPPLHVYLTRFAKSCPR